MAAACRIHHSTYNAGVVQQGFFLERWVPMLSSHVAPFWFALQVKRRLEQATAHLLHSKGYEQFLPLYRQAESEGRGQGEAPLFPGYVAAQLSAPRQSFTRQLFFKWVKQHLRIKAFYGNSENAVKTQIWIAVSVYVLVAIVRKRLGLEASLYQILQILSVTVFEKTPILRALQASDFENDLDHTGNQLILFTL
jgi:hypothetical protein